MTDDRRPLPSRRQHQTHEFEFEGNRFYLTVGFYGDGRIGEVWLDGPRSDSALYHIVQDGCVMISHLLQRFVSPETISASLPRKEDGGPGSVLGAIIFRLIELGSAQ